ncbi:N-acetylglucosamine-6-phosphate deacetylase [Curtobacterium sp. MCSS17_008]|uniref:N-acetylglucosamine-6-phosphate deacetylase n=1 Tax=Curtobacterium sp. MCSS17_008 TaxID=2175647 RepID=UPI000DA9AB8E|nr:N-acetylglucosamine-6-phosphate deacetylase [Curtobacterium sp. MCSS17_008]PZF53875.1 N-acetylglucosamine-6-phosphate deacetylase [Curtobacterium sp. MCSS17_008]
MTVLVRAPRIVTAEADLHDGWIAVDDGRVSAIGTGPAPAHDRAVDAPGTVLPAFVDLHAHGALGHDFASCSVAEARAAAAHHAARGTAHLVASIATGTVADTVAALHRLGPLVDDGTFAGLHLEGPWLAPARRGAHAAALLHPPTPDEVDLFVDAGGAALRIVTLAPELPGALDATRRLAAAGIVVAVGHTDADEDQVRAAVDAGATLVTHLFNGMPPLHHRAPGPAGIALTDERLTVECIVDGHHLDPVTVDLIRTAADGRLVLVSDAMAATGCADGSYRIAGSEVVVSEGVARLADGSSLAGSTITVADAVARFLDGRPDRLPAAVRASSARAAAVLGLRPRLGVGAAADLVVIGPSGSAGPLLLAPEGSAT